MLLEAQEIAEETVITSPAGLCRSLTQGRPRSERLLAAIMAELEHRKATIT